jgi:hypothetical protein
VSSDQRPAAERGEAVGEERRFDEAGSDCVDADALGGVFECGALGKADNAVLGCGIGDLLRKSVAPETDDMFTIDPPPAMSRAGIS